MRLILLLACAGTLFAQGIGGQASRLRRGAGAPSAGECATASDVGKVWIQSDLGTSGSPVFACSNSGSSTYSWQQASAAGAIGGGATTALDNLASVSINASLIPQSAKALGAAATPWQSLYLYGSGTFGTHSIQITGAPTGTRVFTLPDVTTTAVGGGQNLTTVNAVPYVSASGVLSQGNFSISSPATVTPTLTLGSSTQAFELRSRGTDSGVSQGVPYFRSATANTPTALDVMPNGNPASTLSGTAWLDVCSTDLSPSNSDTWNCGAIQASGYIWYINNGSLVSVSVASNVATATTLAAHNITTGQAITVQGGPANLAGTYTLTGGSGTTFTFTTVGVADGTYATTGMVISTAGSIQIGLHNSSAGMAQSSLTLTGASIGFQSRSGPGANTTYANLTASSFALGSSIAWFYNTKTQRMASDFVVRWSSTTDPNGTADTSLSRVSAGVVGVGTGAAGTLRAQLIQPALSTVTFSSTPTFDLSLGNTVKITLTANVTSSTWSNQRAGQETKLIICQDATGGRSFVFPAATTGAFTIGSTASKCNTQLFVSDGTNLIALNTGVIDQ